MVGLITLLIVALVVALVYLWALTVIPLPQPLRTVLIVAMVLIVVIYLLSLLMGGAPLRLTRAAYSGACRPASCASAALARGGRS